MLQGVLISAFSYSINIMLHILTMETRSGFASNDLSMQEILFLLSAKRIHCHEPHYPQFPNRKAAFFLIYQFDF